MPVWKGSQAEFRLLLVSESSDSSLSDTEVAQNAHDIVDDESSTTTFQFPSLVQSDSAEDGLNKKA